MLASLSSKSGASHFVAFLMFNVPAIIKREDPDAQHVPQADDGSLVSIKKLGGQPAMRACGSPRPPLRLQALINRSGPTTLKCSNRDACPSGKQNTPNDVPIQKGFASLSSYEVRGATFAACRGTRARTLKREALPEIRIEKSLRKTHTLQSTLSLCPSSSISWSLVQVHTLAIFMVL